MLLHWAQQQQRRRQQQGAGTAAAAAACSTWALACDTAVTCPPWLLAIELAMVDVSPAGQGGRGMQVGRVGADASFRVKKINTLTHPPTGCSSAAQSLSSGRGGSALQAARRQGEAHHAAPQPGAGQRDAGSP